MRAIILESPSWSENDALNPTASSAPVETVVLAQNFLIRMLLMGKFFPVKRDSALNAYPPRYV